MQSMTSLISKPPEPAAKPVLSGNEVTEKDADVVGKLRSFHLGGPSPEADTAWQDTGILPALLHAFRDAGTIRTDYPVLLFPPGDDSDLPGCLPIGEFLEQAVAAIGEPRVLSDNLLRLERQIRNAVVTKGGTQRAADTLETASRTFLKELALKNAEQEQLQTQLDQMAGNLPGETRFVDLNDGTPLELFRQAAEYRSRLVDSDLGNEIGKLAESLKAVLDSDRMTRPETRDESSIKGSLGEGGAGYFDPAAMGGMMGKAKGTSPLDEARRNRLEASLEALGAYKNDTWETRPTLIHDGSELTEIVDGLEGYVVQADKDPCSAAARVFDGHAESVGSTLRAVRITRLELDGNYDPDRHDPWIARFGWEAFAPEEIRLIPPVVVLVTADHVAGTGLLSFSRLLLSGRPVHVMVLDRPAGNPGGDRLSDFRLEPGYLAMSHREVFVHQTSAARPLHMMKGLLRAMKATRTAVHVVAWGRGPDDRPPRMSPWFYVGAALEGRAFPFFTYDPEAGSSWARRLDFSENPSPEDDWPQYVFSAKQDKGEKTLTIPFTFADFALLDPSLTVHFTPVPDGVPEEDLVSVDEYLALPAREAVQRIPTVWGVDAESRVRRLAVTRELALACRDRLGFWQTLQELAGVRSEYVDTAVARAKDEAGAKAAEERDAQESRHREELEQAQFKAAEDVANRLTAILLELDPAELGAVETGGLSSFSGRSVDDVAAALLEMVDPDSLAPETPDVPSDDDTTKEDSS